MISRSAQLLSLRTLYEFREKAALLELQKQQHVVKQLQAKCTDIEQCVTVLHNQLASLDTSRSALAFITVTDLQAESSHRIIVERDLRKELFYLETAQQDLTEAVVDLSSKRALWREQHDRISALVRLEKNQQSQDDVTSQLKSARELDDLNVKQITEFSDG